MRSIVCNFLEQSWFIIQTFLGYCFIYSTMSENNPWEDFEGTEVDEVKKNQMNL